MISNLSECKIKQNKTNNATRNVNKVCLAFAFLKKSFLLTLNSLTLNKTMDLVYSSDSDIEDFLVLETVPKPRTARQVSFTLLFN